MKQIVSNYTYSPTTNVVTLTGVNIDADQLLLIVAPQVGRTLYNFASGVTGAVSAGANTRVSLNASTAGLTTTSPLVIFYDDQAPTQTIAGTVTANVVGWDGGNQQNLRIGGYSVGEGDSGRLALEVVGVDGNPLPISGTVTANVQPQQADDSDPDWKFIPIGFGQAAAGGQLDQWHAVSQIAPLPVSNYGSVTIGSVPNGSLFTHFGTPTTANTAFATAAVTKSDRKYLLIQNVTTGSNVITVGVGFTPTTTKGIQLTAGAGITFESSYIPTGAVYVLSSVTASNFTILEA